MHDTETEQPKPKRGRRWLPLAAVLVMTVLLGLLVQDFVRQVIVLPAIYAGWLAWVVLSNVPHWIFWALFILVAVGSAFYSLEAPPRQAKHATTAPAPVRGPISVWRDRLETGDSETGRRRLAREMGRVLWNARQPERPYNHLQFVAHADELTPNLNTPMPAPVRAFLEAGVAREITPVRVWYLPKPPLTPALAIDLDTVVTFLESELNPTQAK